MSNTESMERSPLKKKGAKETSHQYVEHPLEPLFDKRSRILILGSFPSVKTREIGFFYGHPQNRFWPMMSKLLDVHPPLAASDPLRVRRILLERGVGLWDSIGSCEIIGSSDSSIRNVRANDFREIFAQATIRHIFCNGALSYRYFTKYQSNDLSIGVSKMPSTSPANASASLNDLLFAWKEILAYLA